MQELAGLQGFMVLPNVGATPRFDFGRGGKQGGVETPDEWNAVVNYVLEPVVRRWGALGLGFKLLVCDGVISELINHAVWADNIILFAESFEHMQTMINDLDSAFAAHRMDSGERYFNWKPNSLEYIASGALAEAEPWNLSVI